jgi:hypothetical protein
MKKPYNGHESWNAWNVALWIGNDEPLYRAAIDTTRHTIKDKPASLAFAVRRFFNNTGLQGQRTPDGARYSSRSVRLALRGLMND